MNDLREKKWSLALPVAPGNHQGPGFGNLVAGFAREVAPGKNLVAGFGNLVAGFAREVAPGKNLVAPATKF
jgi:hypothetical protein